MQNTTQVRTSTVVAEAAIIALSCASVKLIMLAGGAAVGGGACFFDGAGFSTSPPASYGILQMVVSHVL